MRITYALDLAQMQGLPVFNAVTDENEISFVEMAWETSGAKIAVEFTPKEAVKILKDLMVSVELLDHAEIALDVAQALHDIAGTSASE